MKMKSYETIACVSWWSAERLGARVQAVLNEKTQQGYEVLSVSFDSFFAYTAYITVRK